MPNHVTNIIQAPRRVLDALHGKNGAVDFNSIIPEAYNSDWYGWRNRNWGTKWNAYKIAEGENMVSFHTAWGYPEPVIEALTQKFPNVIIYHAWADEDTGYNLGARGIYYDPERGLAVVEELNLKDGGPQAEEFGSRLHYGVGIHELLQRRNADYDDYRKQLEALPDVIDLPSLALRFLE